MASPAPEQATSPTTAHRQSTDTVLMVRPARFASNQQTRDTNAFQAPSAAAEVGARIALAEFDRAVAALRAAGVTVLVVDDKPADPEQRALCFGLAHELCGEVGLGWCRRVESVAAGMRRPPPDPIAAWLGGKYGYSPETAALAPGRVRDVLSLLAELLAQSRARGGRYLLGAELSALDLYWATFCNLVSPLPEGLLPLPPRMRPMFTSADPAIHELLAKSGLLEHRDWIYQEHLELPVVL